MLEFHPVIIKDTLHLKTLVCLTPDLLIVSLENKKKR